MSSQKYDQLLVFSKATNLGCRCYQVKGESQRKREIEGRFACDGAVNITDWGLSFCPSSRDREWQSNRVREEWSV